MMDKWEHFAFSRALTQRVLEVLRDYGSRHGFTPQLIADVEELEGALNEPKC